MNNNSVKSMVDDFIAGYDSENTRMNYLRYIKTMFMMVLGKEIDNLTLDDVNKIGTSMADDFRKDLKKLKYATNTINYYMFACKALWDYFKLKEKVMYNPFDIKKLKIKQKVHYGSLTAEELDQLYEYCLGLKDRGMTKKLYFEFLATVTCRKSAAQGLKLSDIKWKRNRGDGKYYWVVGENTFDKTQDIDTPIPEEFYQRLKENFNSYSDKDKNKGLLFNVEDQTLAKKLNNFCDAYGIDRKGRNICQHSLKGTGLDIIQEVIGDVFVTARAGGLAYIKSYYENGKRIIDGY